MGSVAAERYATALYEVACERHTEYTVLTELKEALACFKEYPELLKIFSAPFIPKTERLDTVNTVFKDVVSQNVLNFMMLLTEKGRISEFDMIVSAYVDIYNQAHNICAATVTSAIPLSTELMDKLASKLSQVTGKQVILTAKVNPAILGGLVIDLEGQRMDSSVRSRIDTIAKSLTQTIA